MPYVESQETTQNQSQEVARKMYEIADRSASMGRSAFYDTYIRAGTEFAQENYHKGQQLLEQPGNWNDELRYVATQANGLENQRTGREPLSFQESQATLNRNAEELGSLGDHSDRRDALEIQSTILQMNQPGQEGMQGIEKTLKYVEGLLQTRATSQRNLTPEIKQSWDERRAIRDALFMEKQARAERTSTGQRAREQEMQGRSSTTSSLEKLYSLAGVPEDVPSRQELLRRVGNMSEQEMHFLTGELRTIGTQFSRTGDKRNLDASLRNLVTKKFTKEAVVARNQKNNQNELNNIRAKLNERGNKNSAREAVDQILNAPYIEEGRRDNRKDQETQQKNTAAILDAFRMLYPDGDRFLQRLKNLKKEYENLMTQAMKANPDKDAFVHSTIADKQILQALTDREKKILLNTINTRLLLVSGSVTGWPSEERVMGDLLGYLRSKL
jgi:hypothetical protein